MKKINKVLVMILTVVMLISCSSCGGEQSVADDTSEPKATASVPESDTLSEPVSGGVLKLVTLKYNSLNPLTTDNEDIRQYMSLVFSEFISLDYSGKPTPEIAESWESKDGCVTWTFKLKQGVKWHDGGTVDASDVVATLNLIKTKGGNYAANVSKIKSFKAVDDMTVEIVCAEPYSMLPCMLNFPVLKQENLSTVGTVPVGSGMYSFDPGKSGQGKIYLGRFDGYYGNKPYIDAVEITVCSDDAELYKTDYDFYASEDGVLKSSHIRDSVYTDDFSGNQMAVLYFNLNGSGNYSAIKDPVVRKAVNCYIDRGNLINAGASGNAEAALLPAMRGNFLFGSDNVSEESDVRTADELMSIAGYTKNSSGMWAKNGTVIDLVCIVPKDNMEFLLLSERMERDLEKYGISVTLKFCGTQDYANAVKNGTYSVAAMQVSLADWMDFESFFKKGAKYNINSYSDATVESLIASAKSADSFETINGIYGKLNDLLSESLPVCGIYIKGRTAVMSERLHGVSENGIYEWDVFASVDKWYIE